MRLPEPLKIINGLKHPRLALEYIILGKKRFGEIQNPWHTCFGAERPDAPFSSHMTRDTDIHEHLMTLYLLTVENNLKTIVELGTRTGESTVALLYAAMRTDGKVYSFDIDGCEEAKKMISAYGLGAYWEFRQADDLLVDWDRSIDHLFIDTTHTYDQTLQELAKFEPHVKEGGIITMHDTVLFPDVRKAIIRHIAMRQNLRMYEYLNNSGLAIIFKGNSHVQRMQ